MKLNSIVFGLLLFTFTTANIAAKAQAVNVTDSLALVDLYNSTNGPNWINNTNWLTKKPVKKWYGITVTSTRVTGIYLKNNQLSSAIPSSIGNLTNLSSLSLSYNQLKGTIPSTINNIPNLSFLILDHNQLSGEIPSLGNLKQLNKLNLRNNQLTGSIPASIGTLTNLRHLYLQHNMLSGDIPNSFIYLKAKQINLSFNQLSQSKDSPYARFHYHDLNISHNNFNFNIEYIVKNNLVIIYSPQSTIAVNQHEKKLSVSAGGTLSNNTYTWFKKDFTDSVVIRGDSTFQPLQNGSYYVHVTNSIATQLTLYTDVVRYTVSNQQNEMIAGDTKKNNHFTVYPNPARDIIYLIVKGIDDVVITNTSGKVILAKNINKSGTINVNSLAAGIYYVQSKTSGEVQKIVVGH